jgi:anti-sigma factor RsiW
VNLDDVACRDLVERITDLLDGRLSPEERAAVDGHLSECPGCVAAMEQFRRTIDLLGRLPDDDVRALDPDVADSIVRAFRDQTN